MPTLGLEKSGQVTPFASAQKPLQLRLGQDTPHGNEPGLADSGREGEISARVGRVRRLTLLASSPEPRCSAPNLADCPCQCPEFKTY